MKKIIHPNLNGGVSVKVSSGDIPIEQVALKDTPAGLPYIFIEDSDIPDYQFRDAWEADFSNPDGFGIGYEAWELTYKTSINNENQN